MFLETQNMQETFKMFSIKYVNWSLLIFKKPKKWLLVSLILGIAKIPFDVTINLNRQVIN